MATARSGVFYLNRFWLFWKSDTHFPLGMWDVYHSVRVGCSRTLKTTLGLNYEHLPCEYLCELGKDIQQRSFIIPGYFFISSAKTLYFFAVLVSTSGATFCQFFFFFFAMDLNSVLPVPQNLGLLTYSCVRTSTTNFCNSGTD